MTSDDLDKILSAYDSIEPSSDFARNVMLSVYELAAEPPRCPFPRLRFFLGFVSCVVLAFSATILLQPIDPALARMISLTATVPEVGYATATVVLSLAFVSVPRLLARTEY